MSFLTYFIEHNRFLSWTKAVVRYVKKDYSLILIMLITSAHCLHSAQPAPDEHFSPLSVENMIRENKDSTFKLFFTMCKHIIEKQGEDSLDTVFELHEFLKNHFDNTYDALFSRAICSRHYSLLLCNYILQRKPKVVQLQEESDKDVLHAIIRLRHKRQDRGSITLIMFKTLLYHGANKDSRDKLPRQIYPEQNDEQRIYNRTPLMHAADNRDEAITTFLLSQGADIDALDDKGRSACEHIRDALAKPSIYSWERNVGKQAHSEFRNYYRSRLENRIFQQCVGKENGLIKDVVSLIAEYTIASHPVQIKAPSLLREYISAPIGSLKLVHQQRALLASVKRSLKKNDFEPLAEFIDGQPHTMHIQDGAGDTVLFAAVQAGNVKGIQLVMERLQKLSGGESDHFKKAITHTNEYKKQAWQYASDSIDKELIEQITPEKQDTNIVTQ